MRILIAGALCALTMVLGACGMQSENDMRASFRSHAVDSCVASSRGSPNPSNFDWQRLCGCAIDRYMAGKSASDLSNANPEDPALRETSRQCAMEQAGGGAGEPAPAAGNEDRPAD
jgi:hypothetical protein